MSKQLFEYFEHFFQLTWSAMLDGPFEVGLSIVNPLSPYNLLNSSNKVTIPLPQGLFS